MTVISGRQTSDQFISECLISHACHKLHFTLDENSGDGGRGEEGGGEGRGRGEMKVNELGRQAEAGVAKLLTAGKAMLCNAFAD